jgi:hypothetical protein
MMQAFQNALYINTRDPTNAVIFDREWLRSNCSAAGFELDSIERPAIRGFHWRIVLRRTVCPMTFDFPDDDASFGTWLAPALKSDPAGIGL